MEPYVTIGAVLMIALLVAGFLKPEKVISFIPNPTRLVFLGAWLLLLAVLSFANSFIISDEDRAEMRRRAETEIVPSLISYETLLEWSPGAGGFGADILVDKSVSADDLRALIKSFDDQYKNAISHVVTSIEAFEWLMDTEAGESPSLATDYLLYYSKNPIGDGVGQITWTQEEGAFSALHATKEKLIDGVWRQVQDE